MKYFKSRWLCIFFVYLTSLGLMAIFSHFYPSESASFVHFFFPVETDLSKHEFIRYRMILWLIASMVFLVLLPIIGYFGMADSFDREKLKSLPWWFWFLLILGTPISWFFYPIIFLCTQCMTSNDLFYFSLTIGFFIGLQMIAQVAILRIQIFLGFK